MGDLGALSDGEAAVFYAEAERLEHTYGVAPDEVRHLRLGGVRNVNWVVGPPGTQVLVRHPSADVVQGIARPRFREPDILRAFSGSGVTPELLHDGGHRHIQELLPGEPISVNGPNWSRWLERAPSEVPHLLAVMARGGTFLDTYVQAPSTAVPVHVWWEERARLTRSMWAGDWAGRATLYGRLGIPSHLFDVLREPLRGGRPVLGMHGDPQPANFLLTAESMKVVDLEMFHGGDPAADIARVIVSSRMNDEQQAAITDRFVETMSDELPELPAAAVAGMRQDVPFYVQYFAADGVMGPLRTAITRLERHTDTHRLAGVEEAVDAAVDRIVTYSGPHMARFGRDPLTPARVTRALTDHAHARATAGTALAGVARTDAARRDVPADRSRQRHGPGRLERGLGVRSHGPGEGPRSNR